MKLHTAIIILILVGLIDARADDFFNVENIFFHQNTAAGEPQVYSDILQTNAKNHPLLDKKNKPVVTHIPVPFLAVRVNVQDQIKTSTILAKAYFYDDNLKLVAMDSIPSMSRLKADDPAIPPWSVFISKDQRPLIYFAIPDKVMSTDNWSAVVVFGDNKGVDAQVYFNGREEQLSDYDFAEKGILEDKNGSPIERKPAMDPLIEHVVQTDNPKQPQITLFMRPPLGMTDASQAKGVLCLSLLAGSLEDVKKQLQGFQAGDDLNGILKYAEDHKLIVLCWGSRGLWDPHKSWDDLSPDAAWDTDKAFDQVANAWENGVQYFIKEYGIPANGYLMWGISGSAQYACRLALRKPDYFLAVDIHIPSSFDEPTPDGRKILWCLTTGERESGHNRSLRFYEQCRALGYPMIYKAIVGLGHAGSPIATDLGLKFFDYALSVQGQRSAYDQSLSDPIKQFQMSQQDAKSIQPWLSSFCSPAFVGDAVNQEMVPYVQRDSVPQTFWVPLPTQNLANAWNK